jgi:hypothetical protein
VRPQQPPHSYRGRTLNICVRPADYELSASGAITPRAGTSPPQNHSDKSPASRATKPIDG